MIKRLGKGGQVGNEAVVGVFGVGVEASCGRIFVGGAGNGVRASGGVLRTYFCWGRAGRPVPLEDRLVSGW